ncbi:Integrin-linked protein kinase-like pat-4, partial [Cucurbita argyrosperma subsp. argyrosperma]
MDNITAQLKRGISRQFSTGSLRRSLSRQFSRQSSLDPRRNNLRFSFGRQSSLDPIRRSPGEDNDLSVPENLDSTMQLLFMACRGDVRGVQDLLNDGTDVNSIDLDGRTALHIAACEGHAEVVKFLLTRKANIDARDRWGSTAAADAKYYGNIETPMTVANPREVPEYELNPLELQIRRGDGMSLHQMILVLQDKDSCRNYLGTYQVAKWNGTKVAVKILDKDCYFNPDSINAFKHELTLLERVRHPNVVQFVGAVTQNLPMMIVSEYHPMGDLGFYLQKKGRLSPSKALRFALDIARQGNELSSRMQTGAYYPLRFKAKMVEGMQPFHPRPPEEASKAMCVERKRPPFKIKSKSYPPDLKELIEECWAPEPVVRPTFSEIIVRLDKIVINCSKHGWWKDTFKLP